MITYYPYRKLYVQYIVEYLAIQHEDIVLYYVSLTILTLFITYLCTLCSCCIVKPF